MATSFNNHSAAHTTFVILPQHHQAMGWAPTHGNSSQHPRHLCVQGLLKKHHFFSFSCFMQPPTPPPPLHKKKSTKNKTTTNKTIIKLVLFSHSSTLWTAEKTRPPVTWDCWMPMLLPATFIHHSSPFSLTPILKRSKKLQQILLTSK